jgi:hypothetical protein
MTVSDGFLALGGALFLLDHRWTELTAGALALAAGAWITRGRNPGPRIAGPVRVRLAPEPDGYPVKGGPYR